MSYRAVFTIVFASLALALGGCASKPYPAEKVTAKQEQRVEGVVNAFKRNPDLQSYFDDCVAYAVYPWVFRAGTGFGGAVGTGWLYRDGKLSSRGYQGQFFAGANLGLQLYRQIIFFRTEAAVNAFEKSNVEFAGQVNAAAIIWGGGYTPAFNSDVAIFTDLLGGLMLEASIGAHAYTHRPVGAGTESAAP